MTGSTQTLLPETRRAVATVLIADEMAMVRDGLAAVCEADRRYQVVRRCADGADALASLLALSPDIAVLDAHLPHVLGIEVARQARAAGLTTRLLLLSPRSDRHTMLHALRNGVDGFLLKTGPAHHVLDAFEAVMAGSVYICPGASFTRPERPASRRRPGDPLEGLSDREFQVFTLLVEGIRAKEIAARLTLSPKTIDTHRASLMRKLDIYDVPGLVKFAITRNLTSMV